MISGHENRRFAYVTAREKLAGTRSAFLYAIVTLVLLFAATCDSAMAAPTPGGVSGVDLWFVGSGYDGTTWTDQAGTSILTQPIKAGSSSPTTISLDANFNAGVSFNGTTQWLRGTANKTILGSATTYIFAVSRWNGTATPQIAGLLAGYSAGNAGEGCGFTALSPFKYIVDGSGDSQSGTFAVPTSGSSTPYILSDCYYPAAKLDGAIVSQNGLPSGGAPSATVTGGTQFELGGRTVGNFTDRIWSGSIDEVILYDNLATALSLQQLSQIRSYLAIKYGITLGYNTSTSTGIDYLSSAGPTPVVWSGANNATYQYDVAGIARDDTSGLDQRVSQSVNPNAIDVTIANGVTISTSSQTANTAFSNNSTFVMWGDNNATTTMSGYSGVYRMGRVWRTQTTGTGSTSLTVQVPLTAFSIQNPAITNPAIWIASDANFQTGVSKTALTCDSTYCTATIPTFSSPTQYFSFGPLGAISGTVFEDVNYGGGAGRSKTTASGVGLTGVRAELYKNSGTFVSSTTTASDGTYSLNAPAGTYTVRAVTPTVSSRGGTGLSSVQTYRTDATGGTATPVFDHVGGETPTLADAAAGSTTLASLTTSTTAAQSITTVTLGTSAISGVDFGYNFDTIVNVNDSGQGSLYQFITNANALGGVSSLAQVGQTAGTQTSIFMISDGKAHSGLSATYANLLIGGVAVFTPSSAAYPQITNSYTVIDGTTQTANVPNTNSGTLGTGGTVGTDKGSLDQITRPTVQIYGTGTSAVNTGIWIAASNTTVRAIAIYGFGTATGGDIYITGSSTSGTLIEKNAIGTSATSFTSPGLASGAGIFSNASGGGTIQNNVIGFIQSTMIELSSTSGWTISGNEVRAAYGNASTSAIWLPGSSNITFTSNLIAANPGSGIVASSPGPDTITNNTISGNGVSVSGSAPSITAGIFLNNTGTTITKNIISGNYGAGILVTNSSTNNTLSQNSIYGNGTIVSANGNPASGEIGIDLLTSGQSATTGVSPYITPNTSGGTGAGGNNLNAFPVLDGASIANGTYLIVTGWARPGATIELFLADASPASGFGQGKSYLGTVTEGSASSPKDTDATTTTYSLGGNTGTDTTNRFRFSFAVPSNVSVGSVLTATSTLAANGTSEFGPNITVTTASIPTIATVLTVSPMSGQVPGTDLTYTGTFSNTGNAVATGLTLTDPIPANTDFKLNSAAWSLGIGTALTAASVSYFNGSSWLYVPVAGGGGATGNYDRSVTQVKFSFTGSLGTTTPSNSPSFSLTVRIQ